MRFWVVKGRPSRNDLETMLVPGKTERWITRKPPRSWRRGDPVFFWKGAPALRLVGLGRIETIRERDQRGDSYFRLRYLTSPLRHPLSINELRSDRVLRGASFLKAGAAGTLFELNSPQAARLLHLVRRHNREAGGFPVVNGTKGTGDGRMRALSIRQPWAELIMRGIKTIEARSARTHVRGRVLVYAGLGYAHIDHQIRVGRQHKIQMEKLARGVLVGSVEIVGCCRLKMSDSRNAGFPVERGTTEFAWLLARPRRARLLKRPKKHPQPAFFYPF